MKLGWDKISKENYYYITIKGDKIIFGDVLDPKTRIECSCSLKQFKDENQEVHIRVKKYFGNDILNEVNRTINEILGNL